ncbi:hypothetical protein GCK72_018701 [Caenorhabditis remanei]|uniref:BTB domain-containing protein n=1 Tax=Caenorhabditis remanei TaxID=31234 RepID=A0A6A5GAG8_CAERE|nr:hypothetical protein GCK72_018701 [Caenorhabditis remanei]KAF1752147.1 hypothetical protein GCK72_018701 [Caenorhabditis remanei]
MGDSSKPTTSTTIYTTTDSQHKCYLFKHLTFQLYSELRIRMGSFVWVLTPHQASRDGRHGFDIEVKVTGLKSGEYLTSEFSFQQPGNVKQVFENSFDCFRNTFFYRNALTCPMASGENGIVSTRYSHYRFLRHKDSDEPNDLEEADDWISTIPLEWNTSGEAPVFNDLNIDFIDTVYAAEERKNSFMYYFVVEAAQKTTYAPYRPQLCWPKATKTAKYLNNKWISVDGNWFHKWPKFNKFMENVDLLAPDDYEDLLDILGTYYHSWNIDHFRLQEIVRAAEKFGFFDFPQKMITMGNVDMYFSSMRSVLLAPTDHPLLSVKENVSKKIYEENYGVTVKMIDHQDHGGHPVYNSFKTKNGMNWTVNLHRKSYSGQEYLCVSLILNGPYKPDENQLWRVEFGPLKHSSLGRLPKKVHERVLNTVQRTIVFPTCWLWSDVLRDMGQNGPFNFTFRTACSALSGWKFSTVSGKQGVTGVTDAEIQCKDGNIVAVNKSYLQWTCRALREWVPMPNKPNRMEMNNLEFEEFVHFLDHLYHVSKVYTMDIWKRVFKVAQIMNCDRVTDQFERTCVRTNVKNVNDMKFNDNYSLEFLKFNVEMRDQLEMESIDEYLHRSKEPVVNHFENS